MVHRYFHLPIEFLEILFIILKNMGSEIVSGARFSFPTGSQSGLEQLPNRSSFSQNGFPLSKSQEVSDDIRSKTFLARVVLRVLGKIHLEMFLAMSVTRYSLLDLFIEI